MISHLFFLPQPQYTYCMPTNHLQKNKINCTQNENFSMKFQTINGRKKKHKLKMEKKGDGRKRLEQHVSYVNCTLFLVLPSIDKYFN